MPRDDPGPRPSTNVRAGPRIAVIGLGEVGTLFAAALKGAGADLVVAGLRPSERAVKAAESLGVPLQADAIAAAAGADIVMLAVIGDALLEGTRSLALGLDKEVLFVDLTAASPIDVVRAAALVPAGRFVDVAINGAVSIYGARTPLLAAGPCAGELAEALNPLGFNVDARPDWAVGDASKLKLVRSVFTKGLELVLLEALLAAEAMNIRPALQEALRDYDTSTIRQHADMYLRTHLPMAERRLSEMRKVLTLLKHEGAPTSVAEAAIARYVRTLDLAGDGMPAVGDAEAAFDWLFQAENRHRRNAASSEARA